MKDQNVLRGLTLMVVALAFGLSSLQYNLGNFTRPGPGLFPLLISGAVGFLGAVVALRSRLLEPQAMDFDLRNIALVTLSLCGMAVLSRHVSMIVGIVFLVFCATAAARPYSVVRNLKVSAGLVAVAFAFDRFLGLHLPLY